jgi:glycosyltransferase involved in cell wall biosynthesis
MFKDRNILCISTPSWESNYASTTVELMEVLAKNNKVLFVNNPLTIKDVLSSIIKRKTIPLKKVFGLKSRVKKIRIESGAEVYVLTPPMVLSINFLPSGFLYNLLLNFNGFFVRNTIRKYLKRLKMDKDLINIISLNPAMGLANGRRFNESVLIYLCYDEISQASYIKKHGQELEEKFTKKADAIVVTSQGLFERKKALNPNCFLVRNAANVLLFSTGFNPDLNKKPQVGFIGSIDKRIDYKLMKYVIESLPEIEFVFIGRANYPSGEEILRKYKNVRLAGSKNIQQLPEYVKNFSVGIIPFLKTEFNKGIYPLKINEYLAAGIPVVSTNFSYLSDFENVIRIAETWEEFKDFIMEEIKNDTLEKKLARQSVAKENSWERRGEELSEVIEKLEERNIEQGTRNFE